MPPCSVQMPDALLFVTFISCHAVGSVFKFLHLMVQRITDGLFSETLECVFLFVRIARDAAISKTS